jgi:hypothetical protein
MLLAVIVAGGGVPRSALPVFFDAAFDAAQ